MFKALLLPNYNSEQPQFFRDANNFAKYWKNDIIYIVTFKGQSSRTPKVDCFKLLLQIFENFQTLPRFYFLIFFAHIWRIVTDKKSLTSENFIGKYQKVCETSWAKFGTKWKNYKSGVPFSPRLPITAIKICVEKIFTYSLWYGKFTIQNSWMVLNVFIEKKLDKILQKLQILCIT